MITHIAAVPDDGDERRSAPIGRIARPSVIGEAGVAHEQPLIGTHFI